MLKPTQDKKLRIALAKIHFKLCGADDTMITQMLIEIENRGYHIGLPPSIEEALNSGDGVYRP